MMINFNTFKFSQWNYSASEYCVSETESRGTLWELGAYFAFLRDISSSHIDVDESFVLAEDYSQSTTARNDQISENVKINAKISWKLQHVADTRARGKERGGEGNVYDRQQRCWHQKLQPITDENWWRFRFINQS